MKKVISVLLLTFLFAVPSRAAGLPAFDLDSVAYPDLAAEVSVPLPAASKAAKPRSRKTKEWTVMLYASAKDKLRYSLVWSLLDMKRIGSTNKVNVVVEASLPIKHTDGLVSTDTIRIVLGKAGSDAALNQLIAEMIKGRGEIAEEALAPLAGDIIARQTSSDAGDWRKAAAFTKWAKTEYPAKRYAFFIYGHGTGFFDPKKTSNKGTLLDTDTKNYVTLPELRQLMAETGKVDMFVMTSCIMQMAEVAWQIKDYTDVIVGSSEMMWSAGYDMVWLLEFLNSQPATPSEDLGAALADSYIARVKDFKAPGGHASALLTSKLPDFAVRLNAWVDAEMALQDKKPIVQGIVNAARFDIFGVTMDTSPARDIARGVSVSGDLYDFVNIVREATPQETPAQLLARQKGQELMDFISDDLLYGYAFTGTTNTGYDFGRTHGLSIHVPPTMAPFGSFSNFEKTLETQYWDLPFAKETRWGEFLRWIYGPLWPAVRN